MTSRDLDPADAKLVFDTPIHTLEGETTTIQALAPKAVLLVNVASKCGLTPQYEGLEKLHAEMKERGLTVVGIPCNQFGAQEPGSADEIRTFCTTNYGVTFPMLEKIEVNGEGRHTIYQALTRYADGEGEAGDVKWNFEKFLIDAEHTQVTRIRPQVAPDDPALREAVEGAL